MRRSLRQQWGTHVYLSSTFWLRTGGTYLRVFNQHYDYQCAFPSQQISSVYPCYNPDNGQMIIGLHFYRNFQVEEQVRTFRREPNNKPNYWVYDLTEDIIDTAMQGADLEQLRSIYTWPQDSIALYVCNGAKLVVTDGPEDTAHNRSLFQQGSLLVMEGPKLLSIEVNVTQGMGHTEINWRRAFHDQTGGFRANQNTWMDQYELQCDGPNFSVSHFNRKVLFLGAIESQYNSACWSLFIHQNQYCNLKGSEGAMMEDVAPWNTGFKLIRARHLFQRSYESCFGPTPVIPNVDVIRLSARLPFEKPADEYIFRRMLGLQGNRKLEVQCPGNIPIPQNYVHDRNLLLHNDPQFGSDDSVRRQLNWCRVFNFETHLQQTNQAPANQPNVRMAPPPLYPPVWHQNVLKYSAKDIRLYIPSTNGGSMVGARCKYGQQWYKIVQKEVPEYQWVKVVTNYNLTDQNSYDYKRFGDDYCWYKKQSNAQDIGNVQMHCLEQCTAPPLPPPNAP